MSRHAYCLEVELLYTPLQFQLKHISWLSHCIVWRITTWHLPCVRHNARVWRSHPLPPYAKGSTAYSSLDALCYLRFSMVISVGNSKLKWFIDTLSRNNLLLYYLLCSCTQESLLKSKTMEIRTQGLDSNDILGIHSRSTPYHPCKLWQFCFLMPQIPPS